MKRQKKRNGIFLIFLFLVFACVFVIGLGYLWSGGKNSSIAEDAPTVQKVINNSKETILTIPATFYNYRYDDEIHTGQRHQGAQSSENVYETPYGYFNGVATGWLKERKARYGCYLGNFLMYWSGVCQINGKVLTDGINWCKAKYYKFRWAQNLANQSGNYDAVVQGIVASQLSRADGETDKAKLANGDIQQEATDGSTFTPPFFNTEFLAEERENVALGAVKENVGFPFREVYNETEGKHYVFDSTKDVVRFVGMKKGDTRSDTYYYGDKGQLEYYYNEKKVSYNTRVGFFPFNDESDTKTDNLDYGFGVKMVIPFYITEDGLQPVEEGNHQPMEFNFSGDDDVWIFIDGELVLDLGGMHGQTTGKIEFANILCATDDDQDGSDHMKVTTNTVAYNKGTTVSTVGTDNIKSTDTTLGHNIVEYKPITKGGADGIHYMTIYYMERGMYDSNLKIDFNFFTYDLEDEIIQVTATPAPTDTPTPSPEPVVTPTPKPVTAENEGTLSVWNILDDSNVNELFKNKVQDMAEDDVFSYKIANKGTGADDVSSSGIRHPSGVLSARYRTAWDTNKFLTNSSDRLTYLSWGQEYVPDNIIVYLDVSYIISAGIVSNGWPIEKIRINISGSSTSTANGTFPLTQSTQNTNLYYIEIPKDAKCYFSYDKPDNQHAMSFPGTNSWTLSEYDGALVIEAYKVDPKNDSYDVYLQESTDTYTNPLATAKPSTNDNEIEYSSGLPNADPGLERDFTPTGDTTTFQNVADTTYALWDFYAGKYTGTPFNNTSADIKVNKDTTSGITTSNGVFKLFHGESAQFVNQFKRGTTMRVFQQEKLFYPNRGTGNTLVAYEDSNPERKSTDYYQTEIKTYSEKYPLAEEDDDGNYVCIYYGDSNYNLIGYKVNGGDWHDVEMFALENNQSYCYYALIDLGTATSANIEFSFHGQSGWDNKGVGTNYSITNAQAKKVYDKYGQIVAGAAYVPPKKYVEKVDNTLTADVDVTVNQTYTYQNTESTESAVDIDQVFVNKVKTANLILTPELLGANPNDVGTYDFTISFGNIWGSTDSDTGPSSTSPQLYKGTYTLEDKNGEEEAEEKTTGENGVMTITTEQQVVISGVPVGTYYKVVVKGYDDGETLDDVEDGTVPSQHKVSYGIEDENYKVQDADQVTGEKGYTDANDGNYTYTVTGIVPTSVTKASNGEKITDFDVIDVEIVVYEQLGLYILHNVVEGEKEHFANEKYTYQISLSQDSQITIDPKQCYIRTTTEKIGWNSTEITITDTCVTDDSFGTEPYVLSEDGKTISISLEEGQAIVIKGISLSTTSGWTATDITDLTQGQNISESTNEDSKGIFYYDCVISENVSRGNHNITKRQDDKNDLSYYSTLKKTEPNIEFTFTNTYHPSYITLVQNIDSLYYMDATKYCKTLTYYDLVNPQQVFLFKVVEYDRFGVATGNRFYQKVLLDHDRKLGSAIQYKNNEYGYSSSKKVDENGVTTDDNVSGKIKVRPDCTYTILPDTNWSWKYTLQEITSKTGTEVLQEKGAVSKVEQVKGTRAGIGDGTTTVTFYSIHDASDDDTNPEGDTKIITNEIRLYE